MGYVRMSIGAMAFALSTMLLCLISFSPLKMAVFMSVGLGAAAASLGFFAIALVRGLRQNRPGPTE